MVETAIHHIIDELAEAATDHRAKAWHQQEQWRGINVKYCLSICA